MNGLQFSLHEGQLHWCGYRFHMGHLLFSCFCRNIGFEGIGTAAQVGRQLLWILVKLNF